MEFANFEDLIGKINKNLGDFCKEFQYKRKELLKLNRVPTKDILFKYEKDRDWAINPGGGTEVQYHIFFRDNKIGYGLGFNTQYVPFKNDMNPVEYIRPFAKAFLSNSKLMKNLDDNGFKFYYGDEKEYNEFKKLNLKENEYYLFGKEIEIKENNGKYFIKDTDFDTLINDLKGILWTVYKAIIEKKNNGSL